jgi:hypothetical protein|tara:strand:- start:13 stop:414 length:402 start_codon:yes stop_codon:yes gene_type:complete
MSDLLKLSKPFQPRFVKEKPGSFKASYVKHSCVVEHLLGIIGPFHQEVKEIIRGTDGTVEGMIVRFTFMIDGDDVIIEEAGAVERSVPNAGEAMKDCISDAVKRAAARIGLGTHLWSGEDYILHDALSEREPK